MRNYLTLALVLFCLSSLFSQNVDSLYKALDKAQEIERAQLLLKIGDIEIRTAPAKAEALFQEARTLYKNENDTVHEVDALLRLSASYLRQNKNELAKALDSVSLQLSKKCRYLSGQATAYFNIGRYLATKGKFKEAIPNYEKYISIFKQQGNEGQALNGYNQLGIVYRNLSNYTTALKYFNEAIPLAQQYKKQDLLGLLYMNIGNVYGAMGNYQEALKNQLESIAIKEKVKDKNGLVQSYINISPIYNDLKQYELSINYLKKALLLKEHIQNPRSVGLIYNNLSTAFASLLLFDSAIWYANKSLEIRVKIDDKVGIAQSYDNLGSFYRDKKEYPKSLEYYTQALARREALQSKDDLANIYSNLGSLYAATGQPKKSEEFLLKSLGIYKQTGSAAIKDPLYNLTLLYEGEGKLESAANYRKEYLTINDSLVNDEVRNRLVKLEANYEIKKRDNAIQLEKKESELKSLQLATERKQFYLVAISLVFAVGFSVVLGRSLVYQKKTNALLEEKGNKIILLNKELHHRVKNNLQTISSLLSSQAFKITDEAAKAALRTGQSRVDAMSLIHQKLYLVDDFKAVDIDEYLESLIQSLANFYDIDRAQVIKEVKLPDNKIDVEIAIPLALIINELITNSFKHAFKSVANPSILISITRNANSSLHLLVKDNGIGFVKEQMANSRSFGLKLVQTLSRQLNAEMSIKTEGGTRFELSF